MGVVPDVSGDLAIIRRQEAELVFDRFDEGTAFAIGSTIRERARAEGLSLVVDIRLWDRQLFFAATPGTSANNAEWVRRKVNVVRRMLKSTYQLAVQRPEDDRRFPADRAMDAADYVLAGGAFPITVSGVGVVGAITVSGLPDRDDHGMVVWAICSHLGLDYGSLALPPLPTDSR